MSVELQRLFWLVRTHVLHPHLEFDASWLDIADIVRRRANHDPVGKAVLHVTS